MFVFPLLYISFFLLSLKHLANNSIKGIIYFILFGLPIYTVALSVTNLYGFPKLIPYLQSCKEITILAYMGSLIYNLNKKLYWHSIDKWMAFFFFYVLIYIFLPLGSYGFFEKILAFKSLCFFPVVYFTARLIDPNKINLSEVFKFIFLLTIMATLVLLFEIALNSHLQSFTGYADYIYYFFDQEPTGNYGLTWTFEIENGMKRFASFFSTPLDFATATLISIAAICAFVTDDTNKINLSKLTIITLICSLFSITLALSRASFASYFIILYFYVIITGKKAILKPFHYGVLVVITLFLLVNLEGDFFDFIINTIQFTNASSAGHILEWLNGLESMTQHPLGIGLGESGRISALLGFNTGGENQFIIIGVQAGVIALTAYITAYYKIVLLAIKAIRNQTGKIRKLGMFLLLIKIGLLIPLFTAEVESYIYISYLIWFLTGLFIRMQMDKKSQPENITNPRTSK